ncbi:uncharacterized protein AB675_4796 [Cyphellophora attinorum]|uniref:Uncharacterized protein n=1 Tax=Cyphellophora attinorum TaxID=1664694 RepID=A0A0N1H2T2_9EURO|nr:uncharacterized protein AB675_4796 [Phialophora attinorum]KPI35653.1 hypothetical protein AB675_4796 [Phialophora attinorum]
MNTTTMGLLGLPAELRLIIYDHSFRGSILFDRELSIDDKTAASDEAAPASDEYGRDLYESLQIDNDREKGFRDRFPGVLLVSKTVRDEALPVYGRSVLLSVGLKEGKCLIPRIPAEYRSHIRSVLISFYLPRYEGDVAVLLQGFRTAHIMGPAIQLKRHAWTDRTLASEAMVVIKVWRPELRWCLDDLTQRRPELRVVVHMLIVLVDDLFDYEPDLLRRRGCKFFEVDYGRRANISRHSLPERKKKVQKEGREAGPEHFEWDQLIPDGH